jgi:beta-N-acetylhexosaminidase
VLTLFDTENDFCDHGEAFHASIEERAPEVRYLGMSAPVPQSQFAQAQRLIDAADTVVFGLVTQVLPEKGTVELPEPFHQLIDLALQQEKQVVLVSFGNPYLLRRYPEVHAYLCAYSYFGLMAEAVTEILFGERIPHGRLPVTIPGVCPRGTGIGF